MRRLPLWLTLVPLAAGIALYYFLWAGWARNLDAEIGRWLPGSRADISGFPYRIEGSVKAPRLSGGDVVSVSASGSKAIINRGPWQPELTVIRTVAPKITVAVGGPAAATAMRVDVTGLSALTSVHVEDGKLQRLSTVIEAARGRIGVLTPPLAADTLEVHLREVPGRLPEPWSPTLPGRGQAVVSAERLRLGGGDALTLASDIAITGAERLTDFARWSSGGTIEIRSLTLADAHGDVAVVKATLVPVGRTAMRMAGTIDTVCPESVVAAFTRTAPPRSWRLRAPLRLSFEAMAGVTPMVRVTGLPADLATRPRKAQLPPCPVIRGPR